MTIPVIGMFRISPAQDKYNKNKSQFDVGPGEDSLTGQPIMEFYQPANQNISLVMPLSCPGGKITPVVDRLLVVVIQYFVFICCLAILYTIYQINRVIIYNFHCIDWPVEIASPGCCLRHHSSTPLLQSMLLSPVQLPMHQSERES